MNGFTVHTASGSNIGKVFKYIGASDDIDCACLRERFPSITRVDSSQFVIPQTKDLNSFEKDPRPCDRWSIRPNWKGLLGRRNGMVNIGLGGYVNFCKWFAVDRVGGMEAFVRSSALGCTIVVRMNEVSMGDLVLWLVSAITGLVER